MKYIILALFLSFNLFSQNYRANQEKLPTLELGVGIVTARTPHYPGSNQGQNITLPFPLIMYRGDIIRSDEDGGLRGRFLHTDHLEINLSFGGSLPVSADDNDARVGMPKLDTILEVGLGFIVHFVSKKSKSPFKISLNLPIRHAFSTDLSRIDDRGFTFNPLLYSFYEITDKFTLFSSISTTWATKRLHQYIYNIDSPFVIPGRSFYEAGSGHLLTTYSIGLSYNYEKYSLFLGYAFNDAQSNANKSSSLFKKDQNYSVAMGLAWWFYSSI